MNLSPRKRVRSLVRIGNHEERERERERESGKEIGREMSVH